jgi:NAD(P)-dependent dehydrogenase (short-subunit alcohol dehydrogenase family)
MKTFAGRIAVITGAGSGFGRELARIAAHRKMRLVLADVEPGALAGAEGELVGAGATVLARVTDVSRAADVQALADETRARFGVPHLLFNNAGVAAGGLLWESSLEDWSWVLGVNLWGVIHGIRAFVPMMVEAARTDASYSGHVVNTSSMAGVVCPPLMGVYSASKHAVVAMTEALHHDFRLVDARMGASVLCPFYVATGIHASERNRPAEVARAAPATASQLAAAAMVGKALKGGKVTAAEVAASTFDAIEHDRFYVFSHPQLLGGVKARMEDIVSGGTPSDPFAERPEVRDGIRAALASAAAGAVKPR